MSKRSSRRLFLPLFCLATFCFGTGPLVMAQTPPADTAATELANRFESMALITATNAKPGSPTWKMTSSLLEAASRLNPKEPRYLRTLLESRLQSSDMEGAIAALKAYLTLVPRDEFAQTRLINLYVSRMQTADAIMGYLHSLVVKTAVSAPVRAHAAVLCAQTLLDHSQSAEALKMLDVALQIDPLSYPALRMKYRMSQKEPVPTRCGLLLAMLRANPLDPEAADLLAGEMARMGLAEPSAIWYSHAASLYQVTGRARAADLGKGGATELYLCDHPSDATSVIDGYLSNIPEDADAWSIRLAMAKDVSGDPAAYDNLTRRAIQDLTDELERVRFTAGAPDVTTQPYNAEVEPATTQPLADVPDLSGDMPLLVKANKPSLTDTYIADASDLAWMRLYFLRDAGDQTQAILDELGKMLPADDVVLARLTGWSYLVRSKWPEARQKLAAVADRDPYAALGLVLLDDHDGDKSAADALARSTLAAHPSGAAAAVLYSAFRSRGAKVIPIGQAEAVKTAVAAFPLDWFNIISRPQEFYSITCEPLATLVGYGQAMLARVTIANTSNYDIAMGEQAALRPEIVFNASARGLVEKQLPGAVVDLFWQKLILRKGEAASQVVRLDRGDVARLISERPEVPVDIQFSLITNPIASKQGVAPGAAGYEEPFNAIIERAGSPMGVSEYRKKLYDVIVSGSPSDRLCALETAVTFALALREGANGNDESLAAAKELFDRARQGEADADPAVKAWAQYVFSLTDSVDQRTSDVQGLTSGDEWYCRLLGLTAAQRLSDHGALAASALADDPDPTVKGYAKALTDVLAAIAAAQQMPKQ
jgi:tetratricopeptide (TPR) repeat protein